MLRFGTAGCANPGRRRYGSAGSPSGEDARTGHVSGDRGVAQQGLTSLPPLPCELGDVSHLGTVPDAPGMLPIDGMPPGIDGIPPGIEGMDGIAGMCGIEGIPPAVMPFCL
jgi:hypothetical protein